MSGRYNMVCDQGSTFSLNFTIKTDGTPWSLVDNYTGKMQVRSFLKQIMITRFSYKAGVVCYNMLSFML